MILPGLENSLEIDISGLKYIPDYISAEQHDALITQIDAQLWNNELKRRVQHYGYRYDYKARMVHDTSYLGPLPDWLASFARRLYADGIFPNFPDQVIVNEYEPGQGISAHIDCTPCFGDTIASLSLGSSCVMQLTHPASSQREDISLYPRSLIILSGNARYQWTHAIPARKSDTINGIKHPRTRRVSLTFRMMVKS
ncbi:MAG TPA: alpha-ketoglutarate-dependent dioxygenase AlkB [Rhodospirillaceae bacterium]|nr:alpha-ketoglutarate-dependent dioxygenase AlkB [Rhodospirillaceae bacterium]